MCHAVADIADFDEAAVRPVDAVGRKQAETEVSLTMALTEQRRRVGAAGQRRQAAAAMQAETTIDGRCIGPMDDNGRPGSYNPDICGYLRGWAVAGSSSHDVVREEREMAEVETSMVDTV
ncbi:hypothetical protein ACLOJK_023059 [Asimina triloba]